MTKKKTIQEKLLAEKFKEFDRGMSKVVIDQNQMRPIWCLEMRPTLT